MFFSIIAFVCIALVVFLVLLILFEPPLRYAVTAPRCPIDSERFICLLGAVSDTQVQRRSLIDVLTEGSVFYEAELQAIAQARHSVHIEAFLFAPSAISRRFLDALVERGKAGVKVRIVLDAFGSFLCPNSYFNELRAAGGVVAWYQPLRWYTFKRLNNRTHRELIVVDGEVGFIGGAGFAAHWSRGDGDHRPPWRDMMCRVRGDLAIGLQTTFAENWLEATGEILDMSSEFPTCGSGECFVDPACSAPVRGMVIVSAPTAGCATRARIVFQVLLASARKSILINSPYFLPDPSARAELIRAAKERGVQVKIITPGEANNHPIGRRASRRIYGQLLKAGIEIHEYQPGMIHKKAMVVDEVWSVVGSTNFDNRSFGLNDEVNLAALDPKTAQTLAEEFEIELTRSRQITYDQWLCRPLKERILATLGRVLERQE